MYVSRSVGALTQKLLTYFDKKHRKGSGIVPEKRKFRKKMYCKLVNFRRLFRLDSSRDWQLFDSGAVHKVRKKVIFDPPPPIRKKKYMERTLSADSNISRIRLDDSLHVIFN